MARERGPCVRGAATVLYTSGKGTSDIGIVTTQSFDHPVAIDERPFHFVAPPEPYSFSGKLISLLWALELVIEPDSVAERQEIVIAPQGKEILLPTTDASVTGSPE